MATARQKLFTLSNAMLCELIFSKTPVYLSESQRRAFSIYDTLLKCTGSNMKDIDGLFIAQLKKKRFMSENIVEEKAKKILVESIFPPLYVSPLAREHMITKTDLLKIQFQENVVTFEPIFSTINDSSGDKDIAECQKIRQNLFATLIWQDSMGTVIQQKIRSNHFYANIDLKTDKEASELLMKNDKVSVQIMYEAQSIQNERFRAKIERYDP